MKGSIQQEEMAIINIYPPNNRPSKSMKQKLTVEVRNRQFYNSSWRRQHPTLSNRTSRREK